MEYLYLGLNNLYDNLMWRQATYNNEEIPDWYISETGILYNKKTGEYRYGYDNVKGKDKHLRVSIRHKLYYISRIVAEAFVDNPDPDRNKIVRHLDDDPYNNDYRNLKWGTPRENTYDAIRNRKIVYDENRNYTIGEKQALSVLKEKQVKKIIDMLNDKIPLKDIAKKYDVDVDVIRHIYKGKSWRYLTKKHLPFPEQELLRKPMDKKVKKKIDKYLENKPTAKATEICLALGLEKTNTIKTYIGKVKRRSKKLND